MSDNKMRSGVFPEMRVPADYFSVVSEENTEEVKEEIKTPERVQEVKDEFSTEKIENEKELDSKVQPNRYFERYLEDVKYGYLPLFETLEVGDEEISVSDFIVDEKTYLQFVDSCKAHTAEMEKNKQIVDVSHLDEITKSVVDTIISGGDLAATISKFVQKKTVESEIDISTPQGQATMIQTYYQGKGLTEDAIKAMIIGFHNDNKLEEKAKECQENLLNERKNELKESALQAQKAKENEALKYKKLKTDLRVELRNRGVSESKSRTLVDKYLEINKNNGYVIDEVYMSLFDNPVDLSYLLLFMDNRDEFIKMFASQEVNKAKLTLADKVVKGGMIGANGITLNSKPSNAQSQELPKPKPTPQAEVKPTGGTVVRIPITDLQ